MKVNTYLTGMVDFFSGPLWRRRADPDDPSAEIYYSIYPASSVSSAVLCFYDLYLTIIAWYKALSIHVFP